jgi:endonuclease YncB( thermonuclease family)
MSAMRWSHSNAREGSGRLLATVELADGRDLGQILIKEELARPYSQSQKPTNWC